VFFNNIWSQIGFEDKLYKINAYASIKMGMERTTVWTTSPI